MMQCSEGYVGKFEGRDIYVAQAVDTKPITYGYWNVCDFDIIEDGITKKIKSGGQYCSVCRCIFKKTDLWVDRFCPCCGSTMKNSYHDAYVRARNDDYAEL